jgi:alpha-tubulin suppressor-like RCC1 family protein
MHMLPACLSHPAHLPVSLFSYHSCFALPVCPQLWSWGWNDRATLGLGHRQRVDKPCMLSTLAGVRIVQVS